MDFYDIVQQTSKKGNITLTVDFKVGPSKDLMVRGGGFYAIWDEERGLWSTDEYDVARIIDKELRECKEDLVKKTNDTIHVNYLSNFSSRSWVTFKNYLSKMPNNYCSLDEKIMFANTQIKKEDYASRRLPYSLEAGSTNAFDKILNTLYSPEEAEKIMWAIGSVISGESKDIQKFFVFYGAPGTGKSTVLNIVQKLFDGYYTVFEAKELTSSTNGFSTEMFRTNPLLAIQHDGDLSRIEDNTKLNSIVSHEEIVISEKYKSNYSLRMNCMLMLGTNKPVKITDAKSGVIRRLVDIRPTGNKLDAASYYALVEQVNFELGAIAYKCLELFKCLGRNYYNNYTPRAMMFETDVFYNFIEDNVEELENGVTLKRAYAIYKDYCDETLVQYKMPMYKFREELKVYFRNFEERTKINDNPVRSYYSGFRLNKNDTVSVESEGLIFDSTESIFDKECTDCRAQYASEKETPIKKWSEVDTCLKDLDTSRLHYVCPPENHIVIDFDLKDEEGNKSLERNIDAANKWPRTYAELSKGGCGIHLHYIYSGDVSKLSSLYDTDIEVKTFMGNSSLRRRLSKCNTLPIETINSGLPLKGEKMVNFTTIANEKAIRTMLLRNLRKEYHGATKPSVDYIYKILEDAYSSGIKYDVSDLKSKILIFANNSTNHASYCVDLVSKMKFKSDDASENVQTEERPIAFYDVEVFPNLFLVNWKYPGPDMKCVRMYNPMPEELEEIMNLSLIGFNCRRYDNHMVYARYLGYTTEELFRLSQKIINDGDRNAFFQEAYNLSYTDVYDFTSKKQSLKKYEIELGIHHQELDLPWDQPVPKDKWELVGEYCDFDVLATEATFNARKADWAARLILSKLSGLSPNDTTQQHAAKIIFGDDRNPQAKFIYTDLSEEFPGYSFKDGHSLYLGEDPGEGGEVYSEPGIYHNVALLDIASMHPTTIEQLNLFGPYTKRFSDIKKSRIAVKHKDRESLKVLLDGTILPFYDEAVSGNAGYDLADLAYALKIIINIVYGLTAASFPNKFRDPRNVDNIVAKRGALFMINLRKEVQARGFTVAHIKTDSIKIPEATPEIIQFVMDYGKKYGYEFEHEATYDRICLVNDAVYIAMTTSGEWTATGAQFAHPYLFKTMFSKEAVCFEDMCEAKSASTSLYLDMNENLPEGQHDYHFIGKVGLFCPIKPGCGGGILLRSKGDSYNSVGGTKGYRWLESEMVKKMNLEDSIDMEYFRKIVDDARDSIAKYGDIEDFISDLPF